MGELILFLMPLGVIGLWYLFKKKEQDKHLSNQPESLRFIQLYTAVPLIFFALFSISHEIKFNWIGPSLLAIIPWLAILIGKSPKEAGSNTCIGWLIGSVFLFICYGLTIACIISGRPPVVFDHVFQKFIDWGNLTQQFNVIAAKLSQKTHSTPIFVPLDAYNVASELSFYQAKLFSHQKIHHTYPVIGRHIFGEDSLMYRYWSNTTIENIPPTTTLILISEHHKPFSFPLIKQLTNNKTPIHSVWAYTQGGKKRVKKYYYQIVKIPDFKQTPVK